jgi:hypothetical protein
MFHRKREHREDQRHIDTPSRIPNPEAPPTTSALAHTTPVGDLPPPELRVPTREEVTGLMMRYDRPLVIDGEVRECPQCGAYRTWVVLLMRNDIWLRCPVGHQTHEPTLDAGWYNRNSGPVDGRHDTFEDGLKHLGH